MFYILFCEFRNRCFLVILTWLCTFTTFYFYKEITLFKIVNPYTVFFKKNSFYFIFTNITELFSTYIQLAIFLTNQFMIVFTLYHFLIFFLPGLYKSESKIIKTLIKLNLICWIGALISLHNYILPFSCNFFLTFQNSFNINSLNFYFEAKINEYLNFYLTIYYIYFFNFQFCFLLYFTVTNFFINLKLITISRRSFYFIFCLLATFLTPPDVLSQLIVVISLIIFYEIIIFNTILARTFKKIIIQKTYKNG